MINYQAYSDKRLISLIQKGDKEAFNILYDRHFMATYRRVQYTIPHTDVDDVTQDIFIALMRSLPGFRGQAKFTTWFRTLTNRQIANYYRNRQRKIEQVAIYDFDFSSPKDDVGSGKHDERITMRQALQDLPTDYQEIILLRFAEALPFKDIAVELDKHPEAVKSLFRRAMAALKKNLETDHD